MSLSELPVDMWCANTKDQKTRNVPSISQFLDRNSINKLMNANRYFKSMEEGIKEDHLQCNPLIPRVKMLTSEESFLIEEMIGGDEYTHPETIPARMLVIDGLEDSRNEEFWNKYYAENNFRWWNRPENFELMYFCTDDFQLCLHDECMCNSCWQGENSCIDGKPIYPQDPYSWVNKKKFSCCCQDCFNWKQRKDQYPADPIWCGKIDLVNKKAEGDWGWVCGPDTGFIGNLYDHPNFEWNISMEFEHMIHMYTSY